MARSGGTFRFSFYVRDWLSGTRQLTLEERGLYIDVLAMIYERGGRLRMPSEADFCRMLACDPRVLRRVLGRLVMLGKIEVRDGVIFNARAADQIGLPPDLAETTFDEHPRDVRETFQETPSKVGGGMLAEQGDREQPSKSSPIVLESKPPPPSLSVAARAPAAPPLERPEAVRDAPTPAEALARGWGAIRHEVWPEAGVTGWCVNADDIGAAHGLLAQGLDPAFCLSVIRAKCEALKGGNHGARNRLSWFAGVIGDARATADRPPPASTGSARPGGRVVAMIAPDDLWRPRILGYQRDASTWLAIWGASPWKSGGRALAIEILGPEPPETDGFEIPDFLKRKAGDAT